RRLARLTFFFTGEVGLDLARARATVAQAAVAVVALFPVVDLAVTTRRARVGVDLVAPATSVGNGARVTSTAARWQARDDHVGVDAASVACHHAAIGGSVGGLVLAAHLVVSSSTR